MEGEEGTGRKEGGKERREGKAEVRGLEGTAIASI